MSVSAETNVITALVCLILILMGVCMVGVQCCQTHCFPSSHRDVSLMNTDPSESTPSAMQAAQSEREEHEEHV